MIYVISSPLNIQLLPFNIVVQFEFQCVCLFLAKRKCHKKSLFSWIGLSKQCGFRSDFCTENYPLIFYEINPFNINDSDIFGILNTCSEKQRNLTLLHSEQPKLNRVLAILSAIGLSLC